MYFVNLDSGERGHLGSSGDDDVLSFDLGLASVEEVDSDGRGGGEGSGSFDVVNFILLEKVFDSAGQGRDGFGFGGEHDGEVELYSFDCGRKEGGVKCQLYSWLIRGGGEGGRGGRGGGEGRRRTIDTAGLGVMQGLVVDV